MGQGVFNVSIGLPVRLLTDPVQGKLFHFLRQLEVQLGDSSGFMGAQVDGEFLIDIQPFRVVVHGFCEQGDFCHKAKGFDKVSEYIFPVQFVVFKAPCRVLLNKGLDFAVVCF